jgi:hypothetical membrane protein
MKNINWKKTAIFSSLAGPLIFVVLALIAALNYSGYSPSTNFLSDLGVGNSSAFFNAAAVIAGIFIVVLASSIWKIFGNKLFKAPSVLLFLAGIFLILVGILTENYGPLHFLVSAIFFSLMTLGILAFGAAARKTKLGLLSLVLGILVIVVFASGITPVTEHVSVVLFVVWSLALGFGLKTVK